MRKSSVLVLALCVGLAVGCGSSSGSSGGDGSGNAGGDGTGADGSGADGAGADGTPGGGGSDSSSDGTAGDGSSNDGPSSDGMSSNNDAGVAGATCFGVCDDNFSDTCDENPDTCPTTQASGIDEPTWNCEGTPPSNVYAYATFPDGTSVQGANLAKGACVVFFEGAKDLFYAKWFKFGPATVSDACMNYEGCICPKGSFANQSFDRRLYAFTWDGDAECSEISIIDHKENDAEVTLNQPVSNECRKYLYQLHTQGDAGLWAPTDGQGAYDLPFSFVSNGLPELKLRLEQFPKVEVACIDVQTAGALPWVQLMATDVKTNNAFVKK